MNGFKRTTLSRMGIFAAFEDVDSSQDGLSAEGQADSIAELLIGDSGASDSEGKAADKAVEEEAEDTPDEESEEEETPAEDSTEEDESDEDDGDDTWESVLGLEEGQIDFDEEGNLQGVNVKVNGESATVKMNDLVAGYQNNKANTQKAQALSEERKAFDAQAQAIAQDFKTKLDNVEAMSNYLNEQLVSEFNGVDWEKLRVENPAEYAAARQDYSARAHELQQAQQAIIAEKQQTTEAEKQKFVESQSAFVKEQRAKMIENNPTWNSPETFNKDMGEIKTFLSNQYGFTDQDFAAVADARLIELVKDAKKFREGIKFAQKKVQKPVPKFQKSVGKSRKAPSKLDKLTKAAKGASGANKRVAQSDAIAELLLGGN